ncbi:hypothetical protein EJ03DRAFT_327005 [Teratosphaeria nubilosa]|uniref:Uncharacterized protein n=1 Tax=Teratosphaeria nubilosa TaxID=161662 RepID=A0A6G1LAI9_9PEZI|nr:hypothetical protein EJ03DRAFT_327005 [Teratosphaeria nubilosa]
MALLFVASLSEPVLALIDLIKKISLPAYSVTKISYNAAAALVHSFLRALQVASRLLRLARLLQPSAPDNACYESRRSGTLMLGTKVGPLVDGRFGGVCKAEKYDAVFISATAYYTVTAL